MAAAQADPGRAEITTRLLEALEHGTADTADALRQIGVWAANDNNLTDFDIFRKYVPLFVSFLAVEQDLQIRKYAAYVLANIAANTTLRSAIAKAGAVPLLVEALSVDNAGLQKMRLMLLEMLPLIQ